MKNINSIHRTKQALVILCSLIASSWTPVSALNLEDIFKNISFTFSTDMPAIEVDKSSKTEWVIRVKELSYDIKDITLTPDSEQKLLRISGKTEDRQEKRSVQEGPNGESIEYISITCSSNNRAFSKTIELPENADMDKIKATHDEDDNLLTITVPLEEREEEVTESSEEREEDSQND